MTKNPVNSSFFPPSMCYKMRIFIHREFYIYSRIREKHRKILAIFDIRFFFFFFLFSLTCIKTRNLTRSDSKKNSQGTIKNGIIKSGIVIKRQWIFFFSSISH